MLSEVISPVTVGLTLKPISKNDLNFLDDDARFEEMTEEVIKLTTEPGVVNLTGRLTKLLLAEGFLLIFSQHTKLLTVIVEGFERGALKAILPRRLFFLL